MIIIQILPLFEIAPRIGLIRATIPEPQCSGLPLGIRTSNWLLNPERLSKNPLFKRGGESSAFRSSNLRDST